MVWIRMCLITFFGQLVELAANTELCQVASFSSSMEDACWLFICQTLKGQETGMHTKVQFLLIQLISSVCVCVTLGITGILSDCFALFSL